MSVDYLSIGARIKENRLRRRITQEQLAEMVNVSVAHISHIETGNSMLSMKTFIGIINALNISADEVLMGHLLKARHTLCSEMAEVMANCSDRDARVVIDVARECNDSLKRREKSPVQLM